MTQQLIAIFKVTRPHPGALSGEIVGYDDDGTPVLKKRGQSIMPGELFAMPTETENRELVAMGAAREATPDEVENAPRPAA